MHVIADKALMFEDFMEESYISFEKKDDNFIANIVTTNLAKKFKEMQDKNKIIILMSGTIHSDEVLREVFGLNDFEKLDAEVEDQGQIHVKRTGLEMDCKYSNFSSGKFTRKDYLKALDKSIEIATKPTLVHVNSFSDLPTENEIREFDLQNLIHLDELKENQNGDDGKLFRDFIFYKSKQGN